MKRPLKVLAHCLLWPIVFLAAYVTYLHLLIDPIFSRMESRRLLSNAATPEQLEEAVGTLGVFYTFPDGSWLAIRYRDSHAGGIWSMAVARDSGGGWYQSSEHFCGAFSISSFEMNLQKMGLDLDDKSEKGSAEIAPPDSRNQWICSLAKSPDLPSARQRLLSAYFTEMK